MTTTATRVATIAAKHNGSEPAAQAASHPYNEPFMYDDGMAWWLTAEAAVGCDIGLLPRVAEIVTHGSFLARQGIMPEERGISVMPFNPEHQDVSTTVLPKHGLELDRWWTAHRAVVPEEVEILTIVANRRARLRATR